MNIRNLFIIVSILVLVLSASTVYAVISQDIIVTLNKDNYEYGENVVITVFNKGIRSISLPNPAPYNIINHDSGEIVYSPIVPQVITTLEGGRTMVFTWNQVNNEGEQVPPGAYFVEFKYLGGEAYSGIFEISPPTHPIEDDEDHGMPGGDMSMNSYLIHLLPAIIVILALFIAMILLFKKR
jgi:hypothetical protein